MFIPGVSNPGMGLLPAERSWSCGGSGEGGSGGGSDFFLLEGIKVFLIKRVSGLQQVWLQAGKQQPGGQGGSPGDPAPCLQKEMGLEVPPVPCWDRPHCRVTAGAALGRAKGETWGSPLGKNVQLDLQ